MSCRGYQLGRARPEQKGTALAAECHRDLSLVSAYRMRGDQVALLELNGDQDVPRVSSPRTADG